MEPAITGAMISKGAIEIFQKFGINRLCNRQFMIVLWSHAESNRSRANLRLPERHFPAVVRGVRERHLPGGVFPDLRSPQGIPH